MSSAASKRSRAAPARRAKVSATPEKQRIPYSHGPYQAKANNRLFLDGDRAGIRAADVQWRAWGPCRRHDSGCRRPQCAARCDDAAAPQRLLSPTARCQRLAKRGTGGMGRRRFPGRGVAAGRSPHRGAHGSAPAWKFIDAVHKQCVFTTHTPVPAGHDKFPMDLVTRVLGLLYLDLGIAILQANHTLTIISMRVWPACASDRHGSPPPSRSSL